MVHVGNLLNLGLKIAHARAQDGIVASPGTAAVQAYNGQDVPSYAANLERLHNTVRRARSVVGKRDGSVPVSESELSSILTKIGDLERQVKALMGGGGGDLLASAPPPRGTGSKTGNSANFDASNQDCGAENPIYDLGARAVADAHGQVSEHALLRRNANCHESAVKGKKGGKTWSPSEENHGSSNEKAKLGFNASLSASVNESGSNRPNATPNAGTAQEQKHASPFSKPPVKTIPAIAEIGETSSSSDSGFAKNQEDTIIAVPNFGSVKKFSNSTKTEKFADFTTDGDDDEGTAQAAASNKVVCPHANNAQPAGGLQQKMANLTAVQSAAKTFVNANSKTDNVQNSMRTLVASDAVLSGSKTSVVASSTADKAAQATEDALSKENAIPKIKVINVIPIPAEQLGGTTVWTAHPTAAATFITKPKPVSSIAKPADEPRNRLRTIRTLGSRRSVKAIRGSGGHNE